MSSKYLVTTTGLGTVVKGIEAKCRKRLVASSPLPERRRQRMQEVKVESSVIKDDEAGARLRIEWTDEIYELPLPPAADNSERGQHIWALEGPRLETVVKAIDNHLRRWVADYQLIERLGEVLFYAVDSRLVIDWTGTGLHDDPLEIQWKGMAAKATASRHGASTLAEGN